MATKKTVSKPVEKSSKKPVISPNHNHFLTVLVLFGAVSVYALTSSVTSTGEYINDVYTNVIGSTDGALVNETSSVSEKENPFLDLPANHKAAEAIVTLYYKGIVEGYSDGSFKPDKKVNRAEFSKMLVEAANLDYSVITSGNLANCFSDVSDLPGDWFAPSVCAAKNKGWVNGYDGGGFQPARNINKAEGLKIILKAFLFDVPENSAVSVVPYRDIAADAWYLGIAEAGKLNAIIGEAGIFNGSWELTRGDVAEMIYKAMKAKGLIE